MLSLCYITALSLCVANAQAATEDRKLIPAGTFQPMFGSEGMELPVAPFRMDPHSITNAQFAAFVKANRGWAKGKAASDLVDRTYLEKWKNGAPARASREAPVTNISWFAAQAFCESKGGRLPTTLEWEYVAAADRNKRDATKDASFQEKILLWYSTRDSAASVRSGTEENLYGLSGLHGKVWEWTSDYNAFFVTGDNRQDGDQSKNFFCGAASTSAANREGYAAFMRYALRSSLNANFTLNNLGFRCAYDIN